MGETTLLLLAPLYAGPWLLACGFRRARGGAGPTGERATWRAVWGPLWVPGLLLALLAGFGLEELGDSVFSIVDGPESGLRPLAILLALPFALVWLRALARAITAALRRAPKLAAATIGLWRPRSSIAPELATALSAAELTAVEAHEAAHARHRDPLRIWLAQLATDLQWPAPEAPKRLARWREELELARDDEARRAGADDTALASALLTAVRFIQGDRPSRAIAAAMAHPAGSAGSSAALRRRVTRLLESQPLPAVELSARAWLPLVAVLATVALGAGICDRLLPLLPGVGG